MRLARIGAVVILLHGVMPAFALGFLRPGGFMLLVVAAIYSLLAWGVWSSKRWALLSSIIITAPQLFIVSSVLFSWQFIVGGAFGLGIAPSSTFLDTRFTAFWSAGARLDFAILQRSRSLLAGYTHIGSETFVLVNFFALLILAILVNAFLRCHGGTQPVPPVTSDNMNVRNN